MLTNEKVISVFESYLAQDEDYDLVMTKRGYALICWEDAEGASGNAVCCPTPELLRDGLLSAYREYQEWNLIRQSGNTERNPTDEEEKLLDKMCERLMEELS